MKGKILNFVKWLINYKETEIVPYGIVTQTKTMDFVKVCSTLIVSQHELKGCVFEDNIKDELTQKLLKQINTNLIEYQKIERQGGRGIEFIATLNIGYIKE